MLAMVADSEMPTNTDNGAKDIQVAPERTSSVPEPTRDEIYEIAHLAQVCVATAKRALMYGYKSIKGEVTRQRLAAVFAAKNNHHTIQER